MTGISVTTKHENSGERAHNGIRHCASPLVGFSTTNSTRAGEPTLSWNQLRSNPLNERYRDVSTVIARKRITALKSFLIYVSVLALVRGLALIRR